MQVPLSEFLKPAGVRFCPNVSDKECHKCKLACCGHPLIRSIDATEEDDCYDKLCIKDCLKMKIKMKYIKSSNEYKILDKNYN